jgi:hypothetical protein
VKCKFYYNNDIKNDEEQSGQILPEDRKMTMNELIENNKYREIPFMIFRTGSCLIVGNCSERILKFIFEFIKKILNVEYHNINVVNNDQVAKVKKTKLRKKQVQMTHQYFSDNIES